MDSFSIPGSRLALRRQDGFTLIELMVALSVMAIIMAIAIPSIATYTAQQEIRGSAQQVVDVLRDARDAAMNEGQPRYVLFEPGTPGGYEVWRYDGSAWVKEEEELLHQSVSFTSADVDFPLLQDRPQPLEIVPQNAAYFDTRGHYPSGHPASYTLTLRGGMDRTETITLYTQTGQVSWG